MITRRLFLGGLLAMPAVVRAGSLMRIKPIRIVRCSTIYNGLLFQVFEDEPSAVVVSTLEQPSVAGIVYDMRRVERPNPFTPGGGTFENRVDLRGWQPMTRAYPPRAPFLFTSA